MKFRTAHLALAFAVIALAACSKMAPPQAPVPTAAPTPAASAESTAATAPASDSADSSEQLAWLAGEWCGKDEDQAIEESWFAPHSNEMLGMGRTLAGGRMISFEYMRIMDIEGTITYVAQPGGDAPTDFKRSAGGKDWIRFENKQHDYPQRIEYRSTGPDKLHAEIGGPGEAGKEAVISYEYKRCGK